MKTSTLGRAVALGSIYLAAFALLVVIQFPSAGPSTETVSGVSIRTAPGPEGRGLRSAELSAGGLRLGFTERSPLEYQDEQGRERRAMPSSYRLLDTGVALSFDDGAGFTVTSDASGRVSWSFSAPVKVKSAVLRFLPARGSRILTPADDGSPRVGSGDTVFVLSGFAAGTELGELALIMARGVPRSILAVPQKKDAQGQSAQFLAQTPMDPSLWSRTLATYREKAWSGLSGDRLDTARAVWKTADGSERFDESYFTAYMAEAMKRSLPEQAAALAASVRASRLESITWRGMPFAGRSAVAMGAWEQENLAEVKEAERLVQARSPELFHRKGIVPLLFDRAPYALAQEAMGLARSAEPTAANPVQALRIVEAYLDARDYLAESENPFGKAAELVDRILAPAVRKAGAGFWLETGAGGACDLLLGLEAGFSLIRLGGATGKTIYTGIGQSLVSSALELSDAHGNLPRQVTVKSGVAEPSADTISMAAVYPLLGDSPYYPHAVSFFRELGPGAWAWTASPSVRLSLSAGQVGYVADYPAGFSHYMAIYGVKPFTRIQLYGLNYNMDAGFEGYNASGYWFRKANGALYVKMRHKAASETIGLFY